MAEELSLKLTVDAVGAAKSVGEIKQLIKDATSEALKFEKGSAEFAKFANVAAQAKDKLNGVREQMDALNPDAKAQAFFKLGNAMVGGFTAAQGAAALFGASTEDVQKALLKVQAAMALLQGFQAIQDGIGAFTALKGAVMTAVEGMGKLKIALIATGIGAIVVLVGALAANWDKVKKAIDDLLPGLGGVDNFWRNLKNIAFGTLSSIIEGFKVFGELVKDLFTGDFAELKEDAKNFGSRMAKAFHEGFAEEDAAQQKVIDDAAKALLEEKRKKAEEERAIAEKAFEERKKREAGEMDSLFTENELGQIKITQVTQKAEKQRSAISEAENKKRLENLKWTKAQELKYLINDADTRRQLEGSVFSAIANIGNLTIKNQEKAAAFQKKVAAVQIIVSQAEALAQSIKSAAGVPFPANIIAIASSVTTIFGLFASIKSLFSKSGDIGGAPTLDTGSGISAPSASVGTGVPSGVSFLQQPSTDLSTAPGNTIPPPPPIIIQNTISESEITKVQGTVSDIQTQATIH